MCARLRLLYPKERLKQLSGSIDNLDSIIFSPNVAPNEQANIIALSGDSLKLRNANFGLIPFWSDNGKTTYSTFNARIETAHEKPTFKESFKKRHCLIPVSGFYEWKEEEGNKQPYLFTKNNDDLIYFAGLWDRHKNNSEEIYSFSILTTEPDKIYKEYHRRKPVILEKHNYIGWLKNEPIDLINDNFATEKLDIRRVNRAVNNPRQKDLSIIDKHV